MSSRNPWSSIVQALLGEHLLGHLVREAVGVVQPESLVGLDPGGAGVLRRAPPPPPARALPARACARSPPPRPLPSARSWRAPRELRVGVAHHLDHALAQRRQERRRDLEHPCLTHRPPHHAAQDVAAVLVRGHHPVGHQERHGAPVIGEDPKRSRRGGVRAVRAAGQLLAQGHDRRELVGLEDRGHVLEDRRQPVQAEPGVDVPLGQVGEGSVGVQLVLHEHEVPELEEALGVVARAVVLAAELGAAIQVELGARAGRARRTRLPPVVVAAQADDSLVRQPRRRASPRSPPRRDRARSPRRPRGR